MYLLDVQYNRQDSQITCWIKNNDRCLPVSETYYPQIYTTGNPELRSLISTLPGVVSAAFEYKRTHLSGEASPLIKIKLKNTQML
jgi:hypothetical protein